MLAVENALIEVRLVKFRGFQWFFAERAPILFTRLARVDRFVEQGTRNRVVELRDTFDLIRRKMQCPLIQTDHALHLARGTQVAERSEIRIEQPIANHPILITERLRLGGIRWRSLQQIERGALWLLIKLNK